MFPVSPDLQALILVCGKNVEPTGIKVVYFTQQLLLPPPSPPQPVRGVAAVPKTSAAVNDVMVFFNIQIHSRDWYLVSCFLLLSNGTQKECIQDHIVLLVSAAKSVVLTGSAFITWGICIRNG